MNGPKERAVETGAALARVSPVLVAALVAPIVLLNLINLGMDPALRWAVKGWGMATPAVAVVAWTLFGTPEWLPDLGSGEPLLAGGDATADESSDAVDRLREQYADGEIGDAEFERRLEQLLATEDVDVEDDPAVLERSETFETE